VSLPLAADPPPAIHRWIEPIAATLEIAGVAVILIGVVLATAGFLRGLRSAGWEASYERYRANLGRGILLGLELLVGADIIDTVTAPLTWTSVGLLGAIVLIRTFLSFSLETEIEGRWPWRGRKEDPKAGS
jgi:uncharacterized membrane protein